MKTFKEFFTEDFNDNSDDLDSKLITMHKQMQKRRQMSGKSLQPVDAAPLMALGYFKDFNLSTIAKGLRRYYRSIIVDYYSKIFKTFKDKIEPISQQGKWEMDPVKKAESYISLHSEGGPKFTLCGFNFDKKYGFTDEDRQMNNILINRMYEKIHDTLPKLLGNKAKAIDIKIDNDPWYTGLTCITINIYWNYENV